MPIHFIVTRVDELRTDQDAPLTEANFDPRKSEQFLNTIVTRVNALLAPNVYLASNFSLIDNRSRFRTQELKDFLRTHCSSSNPQTHVSMHLNKLHYYRSSANSLRIFFSGIVEKKLSELTKIVEAATKNIEKYQQLVQISNSNLTRTWMEHAATINSAAIRTTETVRAANALPQQYSEFRMVSGKRTDLVNDVTRSARYYAGSVSNSIKAEINGTLQQFLYTFQKGIGETPLQELTADIHSSMQAPTIQPPSLADMQPLHSVLRHGSDLREAEAEALREAAADLRRLLSVLQEQIAQREYLSNPERGINGAIESLKVDLNNFFQNVELYRSGVFSHTTKESIATLGIGQKLDFLETEITEEDKEAYAMSAGSNLFPGAQELILLAEGKGQQIAQRTQDIVEQMRSFRIDRPESNEPLINQTVASGRESFQDDLRDALQTEVNRFCSGLSVTIASLIVTARTKCDASLTLLRQARRRRYLIAFAITALAYICVIFVYRHSRYPAPTSLGGQVLVAVGSGVLLELVVLLVVKAKENVPKLLVQTREEIQVKLREDIRLALESQLKALVLNPLNEQAIASRLIKIYVDALDLPSDAWRTRAKETLNMLRRISQTYSDLRISYMGLVEQVRKDSSDYFGDSSRNLAVLNDVAGRIRAEAIEPSFDLLAATREELVSVKTEVDSVLFD